MLVSSSLPDSSPTVALFENRPGRMVTADPKVLRKAVCRRAGFLVGEGARATRLHWDLRLEIGGVLISLVLIEPPCRAPGVPPRWWTTLAVVAARGSDPTRAAARVSSGSGAAACTSYTLRLRSQRGGAASCSSRSTAPKCTVYGASAGSAGAWLLEMCGDEHGGPDHTAPIIGNDGPPLLREVSVDTRLRGISWSLASTRPPSRLRPGRLGAAGGDRYMGKG